jgi:pimeloyl-ACP methyl ester carboxylesterase
VGYGGSGPHDGRRVASAAADVAAIADALSIVRFAVLGHSGGGPYALACAALLPERVIAAVSVSGPAPFGANGLDWFAGWSPGIAAENRAAAGGRSALEAHRAAAEPEDMAPSSPRPTWLPSMAAGHGWQAWLARPCGRVARDFWRTPDHARSEGQDGAVRAPRMACRPAVRQPSRVSSRARVTSPCSTARPRRCPGLPPASARDASGCRAGACHNVTAAWKRCLPVRGILSTSVLAADSIERSLGKMRRIVDHRAQTD